MICEATPAVNLVATHGCERAACGCFTRRAFLRTTTAAATGSVFAAPLAMAQGTSSVAARKPHRIDVHHHFFPPFLQEAWQQASVRSSPTIRGWRLAKTLEAMDQGGVATAIISISSGLNLPGLNAEQTRSMTRMCNDYAVQATKDHPDRLGFFAFMPLPDIDATLKEIEYALDVLKADGIGLNTSYADKWLGDAAFKPVMEELNRRKAVVFVHPNLPQCCGGLMSYVPASVTEYPQDTNRTVMSLLFSGTLSRTQDIRWIFCHAGAAIPTLAGRAASLIKNLYPDTAKILPNGIDYELRRLYYETANAAYGPNMAALLKYVPLSQVMFGTDYPYVTVTENVGDLLNAGLSAAELMAVEVDNAAKLMPRWKT
jgi:predicted TIM-barrel fold metal-dependent hydrolase